MKSARCVLAVTILGLVGAVSTVADDKDVKAKVMASEMNLIGTWDVDAKWFAEAMKKEAGEDADLLKAILTDLRMEFEFQAEGKISIDMRFADQSEMKTGEWKIVKLEADSIIISAALDGEDRAEIKVTFIDRDTIDLYPPKEEAENSPFEKMRFKRVKK